MVTGSLPYLKEANISDPLYKFIYQKKHDSFWASWRFINQRENAFENSDGSISNSAQKKSVVYSLTTLI